MRVRTLAAEAEADAAEAQRRPAARALAVGPEDRQLFTAEDDGVVHASARFAEI